MAKIEVYFQTKEYPSSQDVVVGKVIEGFDLDVFRPLDMPDYSADALTRELICTSTQVIEKVKMQRKQAAELLRDQLLDAILNVMESNDTIMGYKRG